MVIKFLNLIIVTLNRNLLIFNWLAKFWFVVCLGTVFYFLFHSISIQIKMQRNSLQRKCKEIVELEYFLKAIQVHSWYLQQGIHFGTPKDIKIWMLGPFVFNRKKSDKIIFPTFVQSNYAISQLLQLFLDLKNSLFGLADVLCFSQCCPIIHQVKNVDATAADTVSLL